MNFIERYDLLVRIAQLSNKRKQEFEEFSRKCHIKKDMLHDYIEVLR